MAVDETFEQLQKQNEQARKQRAQALKKLFEVVESDPSRFTFEIIQQKKTIAEGHMNKEMLSVFKVLGGNGDGAGCPEKLGCASIGQLGSVCFYLCRKIV